MKIKMSIKTFFYIFISIFRIDNRSAIKNDKIQYFGNLNHMSHLKDTLKAFYDFKKKQLKCMK